MTCSGCHCPVDQQTDGCRTCYWRHRERARPRKRYHRHAERPRTHCVGCGIPFSDGYALGCDHCTDRRRTRLRRGELFTPSGFPGELIDNTDPRGRLVAGVAA